ncbi:hypothetical protein WJX73_009329 [Symbiochloris irregularis]|uniref:Uncharacterized protein n=1 Tax=Symbiochloris irregularis TaxID=706552 RepID=A0AAW1PBT8_9CHLO
MVLSTVGKGLELLEDNLQQTLPQSDASPKLLSQLTSSASQVSAGCTDQLFEGLRLQQRSFSRQSGRTVRRLCRIVNVWLFWELYLIAPAA